jgi:hypothetical protein
MYQAHFKLAEEAFSLSPDPRFIYFSSQHKESLYKTEYAITQKKGISAIYGEIGSGKTSLARRLWEKYASNPDYNFRILPHSNYPSAYQLNQSTGDSGYPLKAGHRYTTMVSCL